MPLRAVRRLYKLPANANFDDHFDRLVPPDLHHLSAVHWCPTSAAARIAHLLNPTRDTRILDVGAGVGKLCCIGALTAAGDWSGVEHHSVLAQVARDLTHVFNIADRVHIHHDDALILDWRDYDALIFYNPFELSLFGESVDKSEVALCAQDQLVLLRNGTRVVTLNGFGATMPATFDLTHFEMHADTNLPLAIWTQRRSRDF